MLNQMLAAPEIHPIDDVNFPSYQCDKYKKLKPYLDYVLFMEQGKDSWLDLYGEVKNQDIAIKMLPQFPDEEDDNWRWRIKIAPWRDLFKPALEKIPGYLNDIQPEPTIFQRLKIDMADIDLQSNSLKRYSTLADYMVLRDQLVYLFVDFHNPEQKTLNVNEITKEKQVRPFLKIIDRRNVINWVYEKDRFTYFVIRESYQGNYRYRTILGDGTWKLTEIHQKPDKTLEVILVEEGSNSLGMIPVIMYSHDAMTPFESLPPMMPIARLQKEHYEQASENRYAQWKQGVNTLVITGADQGTNLENKSRISGDDRKIKNGTNYAIVLNDTQASASYIHPDVSWFNVYQSELKRIEERVNELTQTFLGENEANRIYKSKLEVGIQNSDNKSPLIILMEQKLSVLDEIEKYWCAYYNIDQKYGKDSFNNFVINPIPDSQTENTQSISPSDHTVH